MVKHSKHVPPFLRYCSAAIPAMFDDSMSYYEALCALWKFIESEVVTTINDNADETNEYIAITNDLKDFTEHYFDNLDVQQEINKKLDVMAETGAFNLIIAQYTQPYIDAINSNYETLSDNVNTAVNQQNAKINALSSGTPIAVSSVSAMTDTTKIYVLTTDGNWYYNNGSAWVSGGAYQTSGIGDGSVKFTSLDENLRTSLGIKTLNTNADFNWEQGIIAANGTPGTDTSHAYWYTTIRTSTFIPLNGCDYLSWYKGVSQYAYIWFYDANHNRVGSRYDVANIQDEANGVIDLANYPNAVYFKCTFRQGTSIAPTLSPDDYSPSKFYVVLHIPETPVTPEIEDEYVSETSDNLISLPSMSFGTDSYASGQTLVGDYLISFGISDDEHESYKEAHIFKINKTDKTYTLVRTVLHNLGHINSVDYCEENDCLIFGNGSGVYGREGNFAIYKGFKEIVENNSITTINYSDCMEIDCSNVPFKNEDKWNVVWFDADRNLYDLAMLVTNDLSKFRVLQLAKGNNQFNYGVKQTVGSTEFNGTFRVCATYEFDPSDTNDHVVQDMDFQSGKLYCGVSHNYPYYWVMSFDPLHETVTREIVPIYAYTGSGETTLKGASALCCNQDNIIINTGLIIVKPRI